MQKVNIGHMRYLARKSILQGISINPELPVTTQKLLKYGLKEPGICKLIMAEEVKDSRTLLNFIKSLSSKLVAPKALKKNLEITEEAISEINKLFDEKYNSMYPRTKELRNIICNRIMGIPG